VYSLQRIQENKLKTTRYKVGFLIKDQTLGAVLQVRTHGVWVKGKMETTIGR